MKMNRLFVLLFLIVGCQQKQPEESIILISAESDESVLKVKEIFQLEFGMEASTPIFFSNQLPEQTKAVCYRSEDGNGLFKEIRLNQSFYNQSKDFIKELTILHELIHCELNIGHYGSGLMADGLPSQIQAMLNNPECEIRNIKTILIAIESEIIIPPSKLNNYLQPTYIGMSQFELNKIQTDYESGALYKTDTCFQARESGNFPTLEGKACSAQEIPEMIAYHEIYVFNQMTYSWAPPIGAFTVDSDISDILENCSI